MQAYIHTTVSGNIEYTKKIITRGKNVGYDWGVGREMPMGLLYYPDSY